MGGVWVVGVGGGGRGSMPREILNLFFLNFDRLMLLYIILCFLSRRTNDDMTQFLRVHRGSNFVKTHGGDINKLVTHTHTHTHTLNISVGIRFLLPGICFYPLVCNHHSLFNYTVTVSVKPPL